MGSSGKTSSKRNSESRKPSGRPTRVEPLVIGHTYSIDWKDHFGTDRIFEDDELIGHAMVLRTTGELVRETPDLLVLATEVHIGEQPRRIRATGIIKSCVTRIVDFGRA